jgi:4-hydroxybutyryl-CoA dehydratase/vinylacetyl-CoA-Delta-isomerase
MKLMSGEDYIESLKEIRANIQVKGIKVNSIPDEPLLRPGVNAIALTYDYALRPEYEDVMLGIGFDGTVVNRLTALDYNNNDLLKKLEMCRLLCKTTGCAQRYLMHDALGAVGEISYQIDADLKTDYHEHFKQYLKFVQQNDLTCGVAVTDPKGDRSKKPHMQADPDLYLRIVKKDTKGIWVNGAKANITGAPYVHELIVLPTRSMTSEDKDYALSFAVPINAEGISMISKPAGRPMEKDAPFSSVFGQSTALVIFDNVFIPWEKVFLAGEYQFTGSLAEAFANHHRHSCIGCRAGLGDMIIGASALMSEYNGLSVSSVEHIRRKIGDLIRITEGFYATGVAASVYGNKTLAGHFVPDPVQANIGKLMLAEQIYDIFRIAHEIAGGIIVNAPTSEDVSDEKAGTIIDKYLKGRSDVATSDRIQMARLLEDLTASGEGGWYAVISAHGGGSPEAMRMSSVKNYDLDSRKNLAKHLACMAKMSGDCVGCPTCKNDE